MDLEAVARHALLFDDDAMSAFVNSPQALVEWNSLSIDRYDVRHLLSGPLPPRPKRRYVLRPDAASFEEDLDHERYFDLRSSSADEQEDNGSDLVYSGGYNAVGFSYENPNLSTETKNSDTGSGFCPHFSVPESLLHNLPPNEKVHQIIARTAMFVRQYGGQSEIVLRVKQGDNPTFGFLMPDHHLHPYFRFLVDHPELMRADTDAGSSSVDKNRSQRLDQTGGALSLLGSVYGSGEDEDDATETTHDFERNESKEIVVDPVSTSASMGTEHAESSLNVSKKEGGISKNPISSLKEKVHVIRRNHSISTVMAATAAKTRKGDALDSVCNVVDKNKNSVPSTSVEPPFVEPPTDLKRVIEKIVEFIVRNGKQFEAVLAEQDRPHGRFPFLLPSNLYHPYYLKVLQIAQESKLSAKGLPLENHGPLGRARVNHSALHKGSNYLSIDSDIRYDLDQKEKFKMVIDKLKKDDQEPLSEDNQTQSSHGMDAAAILQAATRGIKNPNLDIFSRTSSVNGHCPGSDVAHSSSSGSLYSSQLQGFGQKANVNAEDGVSVPGGKVTAEALTTAVAGEADSSAAHMTKEQKLKAERLKRAKMFAAGLKSGAVPLKNELLRGLAVEPPGSGISGSDAETGNLAGKEREGSSVPLDVDNSDNSLKSEKHFVDNDERRSNRRYHSRASRHEEGDEEEEENREDGRDRKRSRRKHHSNRSSHSSRDRQRHKRKHSSSKDTDCADGTKHDSSESDDEHHHSRHHHKRSSRHRYKHYSPSEDDEQWHRSRHRRKHYSTSEDDHRHQSRRQHKHYSSSDDEHRHQNRNVKDKSRSHTERQTGLEEGERLTKSDQSTASEGGRVSREASVELSKTYNDARATSQPSETTYVSDELRAKIRAMLMATL